METLTVDDAANGARLLDLLERRWPGADRVFLRRLVLDGRVQVNCTTGGPTRRVFVGDVVAFELPDGVTEPPPRRVGRQGPPATIPVLGENEFCLAVDKPAGLSTVPDRSGRGASVHGLLGGMRPHEDLRIAHRLDRDTSGCLVLAKGLTGARHLDAALRGGAVRKEYLALVEGRLGRQRVEVRRALGPDPARPGKVVVTPDGQKRSRPAHTVIEVLERFADHTLVRAMPTTGRSHQIRVHLQSLGHPIVGDTDYGSRGLLRVSWIKRGYKGRPGVREAPLCHRMFLHASRIEIPGGDGVALVAEAPMPHDLALVLEKLRRFAAPRRSER
jgi:23S rRNA pseudouridine955/2504/2580 synthase